MNVYYFKIKRPSFNVCNKINKATIIKEHKYTSVSSVVS